MANNETHNINNYRTGEILRRATQEEWDRYIAEIDGDSVGVVDGDAYGFGFPIYMV